jgi:UDP-N-acetylglucosamine--N-acetylmuramyl-(pentapeptide) pyrophosphoryl-undecaprenol N-acetylglucosamine transferase
MGKIVPAVPLDGIDPIDPEAQCWAVIAGGGTAGHVSPGLAIARALVDAGHASDTIHYVGSERGIEARLVPEAGFALTLLPGRGIQRRLTRDNIGAVWGLVRAFVRAFHLLGVLRPRVVVALGGYASVPAAFAAVLRRIPIVVAEQNAVPGLANRVVGRFAKASAVSFAGTALPRAVVTGNPVREELRTLDRSVRRAGARASYGVDDAQVLVAVFGGSLGARRINDAALGLAELWHDRGEVALRHVIGERDWELCAARVAALSSRSDGGLRYTAVRYEDDMPSLYAAADIAVCRSGASSVAELAVVGLASVLVPLPGAPGDHQTANAQALVDIGAAVLVADATLDAALLASVLEPLVRDPAALVNMARSAELVAHRDAARAVAEIVEECARG